MQIKELHINVRAACISIVCDPDDQSSYDALADLFLEHEMPFMAAVVLGKNATVCQPTAGFAVLMRPNQVWNDSDYTEMGVTGPDTAQMDEEASDSDVVMLSPGKIEANISAEDGEHPDACAFGTRVALDSHGPAIPVTQEIDGTVGTVSRTWWEGDPIRRPIYPPRLPLPARESIMVMRTFVEEYSGVDTHERQTNMINGNFQVRHEGSFHVAQMFVCIRISSKMSVMWSADEVIAKTYREEAEREIDLLSPPINTASR